MSNAIGHSILMVGLLVDTSLWLVSCNSPNQPVRPNILWITTEDISPAIGAYGDSYAVTPNIDKLASQGVLYRNAYVPAPICSPARSSIITGINATSLGSQHLRSQVPIPDFIKTLPEYLHNQGYYTTNNDKTDYDFSDSGRWDENGRQAHWRNRPKGKPFFSVFNFMTTHEGEANRPSEQGDKELFSSLQRHHNPDNAQLPPYFPDTPEMRNIWARYYDLITVMDGQVGSILDQLENDGLVDNTIVVFFSDHGFGLPRYKRWPYRTGLQVPLIIRVPPRYQSLIDGEPGSATDRLVDLIDLAPSMLAMVGGEIPQTMQGVPFLGTYPGAPRKYMVGFRGRADDTYDICRTVIGQRFEYVRNFMPQEPRIQRSMIFADDKSSLRELHLVRRESQLPKAGEAMFEPKPLEELYDLQNDPYELNNLAGNGQYNTLLHGMRSKLRQWILKTRDVGFLNESEMLMRSKGSTPYEMAHDTSEYHLNHILNMAERAGNPEASTATLVKGLKDTDSGVRYWAAEALLARAELRPEALTNDVAPALAQTLEDTSPIVQITSAEALCKMGHCDEKTLSVLADNLQDARPTVALGAVIAIRQIGKEAKPLVPLLKKMRRENSGDKGPGKYKSWMYPMFIGFAVDQALENCGEPWVVEK